MLTEYQANLVLQTHPAIALLLLLVEALLLLIRLLLIALRLLIGTV